jgi:hypothetical protein
MPAKRQKSTSKPRVVRLNVTQRYSTVLGLYVQAFAALENQLFLFLARSAGLQLPMARAILSGSSADAQIGLLYRIWTVYPPIPEIHAEMEDFVGHLSALLKVRNSLLHNLSFTTSDKGHVSSNWVKALTQEREREHPVTWQILLQMGDDIAKIIDHMRSLIVMPTASLAERAKKWPTLADAWQYKVPPDHSLKSPPHWLQDYTLR